MRLKNGRFIKNQVVERVNNALAGMSNAKKLKIENTDQETTRGEIPDENGIITWKTLAKSLKCIHCKSLLDLEKSL